MAAEFKDAECASPHPKIGGSEILAARPATKADEGRVKERGVSLCSSEASGGDGRAERSAILPDGGRVQERGARLGAPSASGKQRLAER